MRNKIFFTGICFIVLFFSISLSVVSGQNATYETVTANGKTFYKYTVKAGEGLYGVSRNFSVAVDEIVKYNPTVASGLKVGQELLIPVAGAQAASISQNNQENQGTASQLSGNQNATFRHTVLRGETVYSISQMYNTTVEEIYRYNNEARSGITEGQYLTIPQRRTISRVKEENYRYHTIAPKETLFSVARTYSLKPEDVMTANSGLTAETFQIGKIIRIPFFESNEVFVPYEQQVADVRHAVKRGETLYSISKGYNVSVDEIQKKNPMLAEGLKTGMEIIIPVKRIALEQNDVQAMEAQANRLLTQTKQSTAVNVMKVGLLLPFLDKRADLHLRIQEYYEGFLLAVEKLKNEGANIELYVFDIGSTNTQKLESLLGTMEMQTLNLLIGGVSDEQIKVMSDFAKAFNVKYVVPFSSKNHEVLSNGNIFQVNTPQSNYYTKASSVFIQTFKKANVILINASRNDKADFISVLQTDLRKNNMQAKSIDLSSDISAALLPLLTAEKDNVLVPTSGDSNTLRDILSGLKKLKSQQSGYNLRLFGYPEWQTFGNDIEKDYHLADTYFYSSFYVDENESDTKKFQDDFNKWYNRELISTFPKYGMLGYDTGLFFLSALRQYGANFEQRINDVHVSTLQFAFFFERVNNWGGFINTGLYLIHYDTNNMILKINKSK